MSADTRLYEHAEHLGSNLPPATRAQLRAEAEVRRIIAAERESARHGDLDPTPVDDLEVDHDPVATGALADDLDRLFGPLDTPGEVDWS